MGRFLLPLHESPTFFNVHQRFLQAGWRLTRWPWRAQFSVANFAFHSQAAETLEYKHLLADLLRQNCPHIAPVTFCINDNNWPSVLKLIAESSNAMQQAAWILKPSLLNNGQHIHLFEHWQQVATHFASPNRLGGEHVLQQYILNPHLLRDDRKYSIRLFVVLTNYAGAFLYPEGYYNVSQHPYVKQFRDLKPHLTNEHLSPEGNIIQIPSNRFSNFPAIFLQIMAMSKEIIKALNSRFPQAFIRSNKPCMALFGLDFLVDNAGKLWFIEANHGPCFPVDDNHPLQKYLYNDFWSHLMHCFVLPIANKEEDLLPDYAPFLRL